MDRTAFETAPSPPAPTPRHRPGRLRGLLDRLFGYDFFISYAHADGTEYVRELGKSLEQSGFRVFLDTAEYKPGDELREGTHRRVRMSTYLVLVARPHALQSGWVLLELQTYLDAGRVPIVINVDHALESPAANPDILRLVRNRLYIPDAPEGGGQKPSNRVLEELRRSFAATRQETRRLRFLAAATVAFALLAVAATGLAITSVAYARAARTQAGLARKERDKAVRLLAETRAEAAQIAMRRGDWGSALGSLDDALAAGHPDRNGLRLEKVKALAAMYEVPRAEAELESLAGRADLGEQARGMVLLWQGDFALGRSFAGSAEALELIRRAARTRLPGPEAAYAEGLLATDSGKAVAAFERALSRDPFHPRANAILALFYLHLGRFRDARDRVTFAERVFPGNPTYKVIHATLCALEGNKADADRLVDEAWGGAPKDRDRADRRRAARDLVELYYGFSRVDLADQLNPASPISKAAGSYARVLGLGLRLSKLPPTRDVQYFPLPPLIMEVQKRALSLTARFNVRMFLGGDIGPELKDFAELAGIMPDGYHHFLRGMLLSDRDRDAEAADAFRLAAKTPSILNVREPALYLMACSEFFAATPLRGPDRDAMLARGVASVRQLERSGEIPPDQAANFVGLLLSQSVREPDLARRVLEPWARRSPDDPALLRKRAAVELESGAYERAISFAGRVLDRHPGDAEAGRIRASAKDRLREASRAIDVPAGPAK